MKDEFTIVGCQPLENYRLQIVFADGQQGVVDMSRLVGRGVFAVWNNYSEFQKVEIDPVTKTLSWNKEIDLDAENLRSHLL